MSIFKKKPEPELTPEQQIVASTKAIEDLKDQRQSAYWFNEKGELKYSGRIDRNNREIDKALTVERKKMELAEKALKQPQSTPQNVYNDYRKIKTTTIKTSVKMGDIGSHNKKGMNDSQILSGNAVGKGKKKTSTTPESKKKSKVKLIFILFGIVAIVVVTAVVSVKINNCVRDSKDNSSDIYIAQTI